MTPTHRICYSIYILQVLMAPMGAGQIEQVALDIFCGQGHQVLRWLAYAACAQLAYKRGVLTTNT